MIPVGPLMLPGSVLLLAAASALGIVLGHIVARSASSRLPSTAILFFALLSARLVYVALHADAYADTPLSVFNIRDGGWHWQAGLAGAWISAAVFSLRRPDCRKAILSGVALASAVWLGGLAIISGAAEERRLGTDSFVDLKHGQPVNVSQYLGKPVVVNLWASWCPPCRREMPALSAAQQAHPDVHIVFLNQGEDAAKVSAYQQELGLPLANVLLDSASTWSRQYSNGALPATLFFNAQGRLVNLRLGELSTPTLKAYIQELSASP